MIRTPIHQAQSRQELARSVPNPTDPTSMIIARGTMLNSRMIRALERLGVRNLWTVEAGVDALDDYAPNQINQSLRMIVKSYADAMILLANNPNTEIPVENFRIWLEESIDELRFLPPFYCVFDSMRHPDLEHGWHAARTAILAVQLLRVWREEHPQLSPEDALPEGCDEVDFALAVLLHDIGYALLPESIRTLEPWNQTRRDAEERRRHTVLGAEFLELHVGRLAAETALMHHRHFDGTGFPAKHHVNDELLFRGARMPLWARIGTLANAFEVLTGRCGYLSIEALEELNCARGHHFDPALLKVLNRIVPTFEIGAPVCLSSGHHAVVRIFLPQTPFQPTVQILRDPTGIALSAKRRVMLKLTEYATLRVRSIDGRRVEHLQPDAPHLGWEDC